jgi:hypothetical protein
MRGDRDAIDVRFANGADHNQGDRSYRRETPQAEHHNQREARNVSHDSSPDRSPRQTLDQAQE